MANSTSVFVPAELIGDHYRPIGGSYPTVDLAIAGAEQHFRNGHGGGASFRVFRPQETHATAAYLEVGSTDGNPMAIRAVYKVIASPLPGLD